MWNTFHDLWALKQGFDIVWLEFSELVSFPNFKNWAYTCIPIISIIIILFTFEKMSYVRAEMIWAICAQSSLALDLQKDLVINQNYLLGTVVLGVMKYPGLIYYH